VRIKVLLAEDSALLRQGLERLLAADDGIELVGSVGDLPSLQKAVQELGPDVVVSDIRMPPTKTDEGIQMAAQLRAERPGTGVVLLSQHADATFALRLLEGGSGGRAYLLKERVGDVGELTNAVRRVAEGGSVIDPTVVEQLVAANSGPRNSPLRDLTARELEVLGEMAQGKSNAAIAGTLFLSERAIEKHTNSIFSKLALSEERDLNRRVKAVLLYLHDHGGASAAG
jgi:DNA-binding NarL/FixJ family response regulator